MRSRSAALITGEGFFEHLLVAALERAVALAQMDRLALAVAKDLELDVARVAQVLFEIDRRVAEGGLGFRAGLLHQPFEIVGAGADLHAAPAAARSGLDDHRIADFLGDLSRFLDIRDRAVRAGHQRQAERPCGALGFHLVAHRADVLGLGADPGDAVGFDDFGKARVFRQEAIARMDCIGLGDLGRRDDRGDVEIAVLGRGRPDADRMVGQADMHGISVGGGMDRHRLDAHFLGCAMDAQRDFAAVGDQQALDGHGVFRPLRDHDERLVEFDRLRVLDENGLDRACGGRDDRVHDLHRLDDQQGVASLDGLAHADKGSRARFGREVAGADHRRLDRTGQIGGRSRFAGGSRHRSRREGAAGAATICVTGAAVSVRATRILRAPSSTSISVSPVSARSSASSRTRAPSIAMVAAACLPWSSPVSWPIVLTSHLEFQASRHARMGARWQGLRRSDRRALGKRHGSPGLTGPSGGCQSAATASSATM
jgi:hypothetical protein